MGELLENENIKTVDEITRILPIKARASTWGDEIYFPIKVEVKTENSQPIVDKGDIAYWPPGDSLCIFFGLTPSSKGDEIKPASPVNVVGKILADSTVFKKVKNGDEVLIDKV